MHTLPLSVIARFTLLEIRYGHLLWIGLLTSMLLTTAGFFVQALAVIESDISAVSIIAPIARLAAIAIIGTFVISGTCRTLEQRGLDMILSAPLSRPQWLLGRMTGLILAAVAIAAFAGLPLTLFVAPILAVQWTISLAGELSLIAALGLMLSVSLGKLPAALLSLFSIYLCARTIGVISLLNGTGQTLPATVDPVAVGATEAAGHTGLLTTASDILVQGLALLMPRVDLMSQTQWLTQPATETALMPVGNGLLQAGLYIAIALTVGIIDFERRNV